jgi:hypothetical protein
MINLVIADKFNNITEKLRMGFDQRQAPTLDRSVELTPEKVAEFG